MSELFEGDDPGLHLDPPEAIVILSAEELEQVEVPLLEGKWMPSAVNGLWVRLDPERPELKQERHVHVAQKKHLRSPDKQASWNQSGRRHDRHSFNAKFGARADVQTAARAALGLPDTFLLEDVPRRAALLLEALSSDPRPLITLQRISSQSRSARIKAAAPPAPTNLSHEELRAFDATDFVIRIVRTDEELMAGAFRDGARWGPSLTASHEIVSDSQLCMTPITPAGMAQSLSQTLLAWLEQGWIS